MAWRDGPLLGFDLETTGIDTKRDVPVQVALVWTEADRVVTADTWLVNPGRDIPDEAIAIHGISSERARLEAAHSARRRCASTRPSGGRPSRACRSSL
jgi:DNA polymerase-3 subunit epsilon